MTNSGSTRPKYRITTLGTLGAAASAISVFSLLQNAFEFGVSPILYDFILYYRELGQWVFGWIGWPFGIRIPNWLIDCWILSSVGVSIASRTAFRKEFPAKPGSHPFLHASTFLLLPIGIFSLIGILCLIFSLSVPVMRYWMHRVGYKPPLKDRVLLQLTQQETLTFVALLLLFFALNAYGPSASS